MEVEILPGCRFFVSGRKRLGQLRIHQIKTVSYATGTPISLVGCIQASTGVIVIRQRIHFLFILLDGQADGGAFVFSQFVVLAIHRLGFDNYLQP
ncbi:hypothetical protein D3C72_2288370 [compost metagenome]